MNIGEIIKEYRRTNSYTMQEFANRCQLSKAYISMLENGKRPNSNRVIIPSLKTYSKIANAMHITLNELIEKLDENTDISLNNTPKYDYYYSENNSLFVVEEKIDYRTGQDLSAHTMLTDTESKILSICSDLNSEGCEELLKYAKLLATSEQYKKHRKHEMVEEA